MPRIHETLSGHRIEYEDPSPKVAKFLARLAKMAGDPKVDEDEMVALAYSRENPILDHTFFPTRGAVTKAVLEDPVYHVITDLLARKQVAADGIDVGELAASHTLSVADAAKKLGVHESAVRQAIQSYRLASWVKDGRHFIDPRSLASFEVSNRGPKRAPGKVDDVDASDVVAVSDTLEVGLDLEVCLGHDEGVSFQVKHPGELVKKSRVRGNITTGLVEKWRRVVVLSKGESGSRLFVLEPGSTEERLSFGPFFVRGKFKIVEKVNETKTARAEWKSVEAR